MGSIRHQTTDRRPATPRVCEALVARGTSVHAWAKEHGYPNQSVYTVIERWIDNPERRGRLPLGGISRQIVRDLQATLGADVVPLEDARSSRPALERAA